VNCITTSNTLKTNTTINAAAGLTDVNTGSFNCCNAMLIKSQVHCYCQPWVTWLALYAHNQFTYIHWTDNVKVTHVVCLQFTVWKQSKWTVLFSGLDQHHQIQEILAYHYQCCNWGQPVLSPKIWSHTSLHVVSHEYYITATQATGNRGWTRAANWQLSGKRGCTHRAYLSISSTGSPAVASQRVK